MSHRDGDHVLDFCIRHLHVHTLCCYRYVLVRGSSNTAAQPQLERQQSDDGRQQGADEWAHDLICPEYSDVGLRTSEAREHR